MKNSIKEVIKNLILYKAKYFDKVKAISKQELLVLEETK